MPFTFSKGSLKKGWEMHVFPVGPLRDRGSWEEKKKRSHNVYSFTSMGNGAEKGVNGQKKRFNSSMGRRKVGGGHDRSERTTTKRGESFFLSVTNPWGKLDNESPGDRKKSSTAPEVQGTNW